MAESSINVTEGSGKRLHTYDRTVAGTLVQDQFVVPGEYPLASYIANCTATIATTGDATFQIISGATLNVRIRRIRVEQSANAGSASLWGFTIIRLTTAGTGGTALTPAKLDLADAAAGASCMYNIASASSGTESTQLTYGNISIRTASNAGAYEDVWVWEQAPGIKPILIPASSGSTYGLEIKNGNGLATATVSITVEFVETSY